MWRLDALFSDTLESLVFRSFFPVPKLFFGSALLCMLLTTLVFQFAGEPVRRVISIDRFLAPAICSPDQLPQAETPVAPDPNALPIPEGGPTQIDPSAPAPATTQAAPPEVANTALAAANCVAEDPNFLNVSRIW